MVCTSLGELDYCSCLPVLAGPDWVLLSYVLETFFNSSVRMSEKELQLLSGVHPLQSGGFV